MSLFYLLALSSDYSADQSKTQRALIVFPYLVIDFCNVYTFLNYEKFDRVKTTKK